MAQYLLSVWHVDAYPNLPEDEMMAAFERVGAFNEKLQESGAWVFACGLEQPSTATVVDNTSGDVVVTDGPFSESKEIMGGFWVVEAPDLDAALELGKQAQAACGNVIEVRPLQGG